MDFSFIHFYECASVDIKRTIDETAEIFPECRIDWKELPSISTNEALIIDTKHPFHKQPKTDRISEPYDQKTRLYDAFELQRIFAQVIPDQENQLNQLHIFLTDLLACTFSEDDWRYHARTVVCGTPSIVSIPGIIEAPARPREFYLNLGLGLDATDAKKNIEGRFLDYGDDRILDAATNYVLQAIFFFLTDGEPFCENISCRLFNAHWQEELVRILKEPSLCQRHTDIAEKFNQRLSRMKRM